MTQTLSSPVNAPGANGSLSILVVFLAFFGGALLIIGTFVPICRAAADVAAADALSY